MPSSWPVPDYPVTINAEPDKRQKIAVGAGHVLVDGKQVEPASYVVVDHAAEVSGDGLVTVSDTDEKVPEPKKPAKKAAPKAKAAPKKAKAKK